MKQSNLIINADDFGYSAEVNDAIVACFKKKIINSTTIMVNMPYFKEALILSDQYGFKDRVGIHINLTEGKPLTNLRGTGLVNEDGCFSREKMLSPLIFFSPVLKKKIKLEILEQYKVLVENNLCPSHIDSHHHVHHLPWMAPLFFSLASREKKKLRLRRTKLRKNVFADFYTLIYNRKLKRNGINFSELFGGVRYFKYYLRKNKNINKTIEVMVHPVLYKNELIDPYSPGNFESIMEDIIKKYDLYPDNK